MNSILYLVHRLPYPPNKGDKITSFNLLKYLSKKYKIYLGCFIDDPTDWQYVEYVQDFCEDSCIVNLNTTKAKILSIRGLFTGEALSIPYYRNKHLQNWVDDTINNTDIDSVLIFSGVMAQYVSGKLSDNIRSVLDLEDVDSDKWRLYAKDHQWPMSWLYQRESEKLLAFEKAMANEFDVTVLVSKEEADFFKSLAPELSEKIINRVQGVDSEYFSPSLSYENPYPEKSLVLTFTGAMDYWPNINAAIWFAEEIFPNIKLQFDQALFYIVGMNPSDDVKKLAENNSIFVTGGVPDVRPYIAHSALAVIPLRLARGIQNKVLEAMAMEKQILATSNAMQGIEQVSGFSALVADDEQSMVNGAVELLSGRINQDVKVGRSCVLEHYNWDTNLRKIELLLKDGLD